MLRLLCLSAVAALWISGCSCGPDEPVDPGGSDGVDGGGGGGGGGGDGGGGGGGRDGGSSGIPAAPPTVTSISPDAGSYGTTIIAVGSGLNQPISISFEGTAARAVIDSRDAGALAFRYPFPARGKIFFRADRFDAGFAEHTFTPDLLTGFLPDQPPFTADSFYDARALTDGGIAALFHNKDNGTSGLALFRDETVTTTVFAADEPIEAVAFMATAQDSVWGAAISRVNGGTMQHLWELTPSGLIPTGIAQTNFDNLLAVGEDATGRYIWAGTANEGFTLYRKVGERWLQAMAGHPYPEGYTPPGAIAAQGGSLGVSWSQYYRNCTFFICSSGYSLKVATAQPGSTDWVTRSVASAGPQPDKFRLRAEHNQWSAEMCVYHPGEWVVIFFIPYWIPGYYDCERTWRDTTGRWNSVSNPFGLTRSGIIEAREESKDLFLRSSGVGRDGGVEILEDRFLLWPSVVPLAAEQPEGKEARVLLAFQNGLYVPFSRCPETPCGVGQRCVEARCVCDETSCPTGCCSGERCLPGTEMRACGAQGTTCAACDVTRADTCGPSGCQCGNGSSCAAGTVCQAGACVCTSASCSNGCCQGNVCQPGTATEACGRSGGACTTCQLPRSDTCSPAFGCGCGSGPACGAGSACQNGVCVCDATTCPNGCCQGGRCRTPTFPSLCGTGGVACQSCSSVTADVCTATGCGCGSGAACGAGSECRGGVCVCDGSTCPNGCCDGATCRSPSLSACGMGGSTCTSCEAGRADNCSASGECRCGSSASCTGNLRCRSGFCVL